MPLNLAKLVANKASADIDFGPAAGVLHVEYYPAKLTARMLATYTAVDPAALSGATPERVLQALSSPSAILLALLASWDLTATQEDGSESVLPIDRETLEGLGIQVQWTLLNGIMAAQGSAGDQGKAAAPEGSVSAPASDATSSPTAG